jgi:hypothetical protein
MQARKQISQIALWSMLAIGFFVSVLIIELVQHHVPQAYMVISHNLRYNALGRNISSGSIKELRS